jgi:antitoxin component YwqK of YwqJK toxin-antitoxin module
MKTIVSVLLIFLSSITFGQFFQSKKNLSNDNGSREGMWIEYYDKGKNSISSKIRYKNGQQTGICKFYHPNGNRRLKWHYYKNRIRAKYYFENGNLEQKGWSKIEYSGKDIHYYWHGKWKFYDIHRKLIRVGNYINGEEITQSL